MTETRTGERRAAISTLGERHAGLRLSGEEPVLQMRRSLEHHGQLTALSVYVTDSGGLEVIDGFKRLRAARQLDWKELRVHVLGEDLAEATAAIVLLNETCGLTEIEQGWVCRLLHRDQGLPQHEVGRLLGRHKSWVCRRLLLVEELDDAVQAHVRLGLLMPRTAIELSRLPRGNQLRAAEVVMRRGLTTAQAARLTQMLLACSDAAARDQRLREAMAATEPLPTARPARRTERPAEALLRDIDAVTRISARLQARLRELPPSAWEPRVAALLDEGMRALSAVLHRLADTLDRVLAGEDVRGEVLE
jgi:ParB-like chromosome segregation protein Spo0J